MDRRVVLLRGINLGPRNRIAMPELRELLSSAGYDNVRTHLQSGNIVLDNERPPTALEAEVERLIAEQLELDIAAIVRTRRELAAVVELNPLASVASNPKRYQVSFLAGELPAERTEQLSSLATDSERLAIHGRELYAWHPDGIARSKLWASLAGPGLGVKSTARNWNTVEALLALASE